MSSDDWRPNWTSTQIAAAKSEVQNGLRNGAFREILEKNSKTCAGTRWFNRSPAQRIACKIVSTNESIIIRRANDAPRVLEIISTQWDTYIALVRSVRGQEDREMIIKRAQESPASLYIFLTDLVFKYWDMHGGTGYETSAQSIWQKIGADNRFLWDSSKKLQEVFL